jgi:hypothetical protein
VVPKVVSVRPLQTAAVGRGNTDPMSSFTGARMKRCSALLWFCGFLAASAASGQSSASYEGQVERNVVYGM